MVHVDSPKEASTVKKMNGQPQLLSSDKMTQYFKEQTKLCFEKKYIVFTKIWGFKLILLTVAVPKNCITPKENWGYKYSERATLWRNLVFQKSLLQVQTSAISLLLY